MENVENNRDLIVILLFKVSSRLFRTKTVIPYENRNV